MQKLSFFASLLLFTSACTLKPADFAKRSESVIGLGASQNPGDEDNGIPAAGAITDGSDSGASNNSGSANGTGSNSDIIANNTSALNASTYPSGYFTVDLTPDNANDAMTKITGAFAQNYDFNIANYSMPYRYIMVDSLTKTTRNDLTKADACPADCVTHPTDPRCAVQEPVPCTLNMMTISFAPCVTTTAGLCTAPTIDQDYDLDAITTNGSRPYASYMQIGRCRVRNGKNVFITYTSTQPANQGDPPEDEGTLNFSSLTATTSTSTDASQTFNFSLEDGHFIESNATVPSGGTPDDFFATIRGTNIEVFEKPLCTN